MGKKIDFENEEYIINAKKRFYEKIKIIENGCWIWCGGTNQKYGILRFKKKNLGAHRFSYEFIKNEKIGDKFVCHKCDNPICVNPDHLFLGTHKDNMKDATLKKRMAFGEKKGFNKLKEKDVQEIQRLVKIGLSQSQIAKIFEIEQTNISLIMKNKNWKNSKKLIYNVDLLINCMVNFFGEMETYKLLLFYEKMEKNL